VAAGERLRSRFGAGTVFVPVEAVTDAGLVLAAIGRAAGADLAGAGSPCRAAGGRRVLAGGGAVRGPGPRGGPGFTLTEHNAAAATEICRRLE
jgi:predicted ATPase